MAATGKHPWRSHQEHLSREGRNKHMSNQEQILKALEGYIPADQREAVAKTIDSFLEGAVEELDSEYETKLAEIKAGYEKELKEAEEIAEAGYAKAWGIIGDLRDRIETMPGEFEAQVKEEYQLAYNMIQEEKAKTLSLEADYSDYSKKQAHKLKEFMVDKLDLFCKENVSKFYETARKDLVSDPTVLEHRLAFDKILDIAGNYLSDEERTFATSSKVDSITRELDTLRGQMKIVEQKNMRLDMEKNKLLEQVRASEKMLTESTQKVEKKARAVSAANAEGRGSSEVKNTKVIITESTGEERVKQTQQETIGFSESEKEMIEYWKKASLPYTKG